MVMSREWSQERRKHVFAIDSTPEFLDVVRVLLQNESYNVTTTNYVPRTYEQIAALQPDLLVVDLGRNEKTAHDLLEQLQVAVITRHIPIIVTSANPSMLSYVQQQRYRFGGSHFIAKPLDEKELLEAVRSHIGSA